MKFFLPLVKPYIRFLSNGVNLLYPAACPVCKGKGSSLNQSHFYLCNSCWDKIEFLKYPLCPRCGKPFPSKISLSRSPGHLCSECRETKTYFDKAIALGPYEGTLAEAIHLFKYKGKKGLGRPLGKIMADYLNSNNSIFHAETVEVSSLTILPVPLHPRRLREREFNQSLLLAKEIGRTLGIPFIPDNLRRIRWTKPQIELKGEERLTNVKGAFGLKEPGEIEGKSFLLIDDVYTTGATVRECSKVLKKAGAEKVYVFTLARVI